MDGKANRRELSLNVVTINKPKMLGGLAQKGIRLELGVYGPQPQPHKTPADRQCLTHPGNQAERGKPLSLPQGKVSRKASRKRCGYERVEKAKAML
jgi:hypothetical protein